MKHDIAVKTSSITSGLWRARVNVAPATEMGKLISLTEKEETKLDIVACATVAKFLDGDLTGLHGPVMGLESNPVTLGLLQTATFRPDVVTWTPLTYHPAHGDCTGYVVGMLNMVCAYATPVEDNVYDVVLGVYSFGMEISLIQDLIAWAKDIGVNDVKLDYPANQVTVRVISPQLMGTAELMRELNGWRSAVIPSRDKHDGLYIERMTVDMQEISFEIYKHIFDAVEGNYDGVHYTAAKDPDDPTGAQAMLGQELTDMTAWPLMPDEIGYDYASHIHVPLGDEPPAEVATTYILAMTAFNQQVERFREILDAIGESEVPEVEPTNWHAMEIPSGVGDAARELDSQDVDWLDEISNGLK